MKIKELLEKYGEVEISEEKEKEIKNLLGVKENKKWKPEYNVRYWCLLNYGKVDSFLNGDQKADTYRYFRNNCFKTQKEAEFHSEQIKVYNELKNFADENNDRIDWKNDDQSKYYIYFDYGNDNILIYNTLVAKGIGQIYFSTKELAEQAIKTVGEERIKKYLFGVEKK